MRYAVTDQPAASEPADVPETATANLAAIMRLAPDSPYHAMVTSETSRRKRLYELLADSDDPLWKEIGTQLRDGQMRLRDIWGVDAYCTHLIDSIDKHSSDFPAALSKAREQLEADQPTRQWP
jgi:hypothetical protein